MHKVQLHAIEVVTINQVIHYIRHPGHPHSCLGLGVVTILPTLDITYPYLGHQVTCCTHGRSLLEFCCAGFNYKAFTSMPLTLIS